MKTAIAFAAVAVAFMTAPALAQTSKVGGSANGYPYANRYLYGNSYASTQAETNSDGYTYNGIAFPTSSNFDARNAFTCRPGTLTKMPNGQTTTCQ